MLLLLLRHGEASRHADDSLRELTPAGQAMARNAAGIILAGQLSPALICSSPILRAQQTARIVAELLGVPDVSASEYLTPYADHRQVFGLLNSLAEERVLLVGHEPHLSTMISLLATGNREGRYDVGVGTLAALDVGRPVGPSSGKLLWMRPPTAG